MKKPLTLALLFSALALFGCTSASYNAPSSPAAAVPGQAVLALQPLALPSLAATIAPEATATPTPKPTATPAPTPTPKPPEGCEVQVTNIGRNPYTGKYQYTVKAVFSRLPTDVRIADLSCDGGATTTPIEIKNNAVERICSYSTSNPQTAKATAGTAECTAAIG